MGKKTQRLKNGLRTMLGDFRQRHKTLLKWLVILVVVILGLAGYQYKSYLSRWSDKDYAAIEQTVEEAMKNTGAAEVKKYKSCYYQAPEKYSRIRLYCSVELAAFIPYESDQQVISIAESFENEVKRIGTVSDISDNASDIAQNPHDSNMDLYVDLKDPLPQKSCQFMMATGEWGPKIIVDIRDTSGRDVIGIAFRCSHESREEYFPVTYRQGS